MKRRAIVFITMLLLLTLAGCGGRQNDAPNSEGMSGQPNAAPYDENAGAPAAQAPSRYLPETSPAKGPSAEELVHQEYEQRAREREEQLMAYFRGMTLEEKVGQLFFAFCPASGATDKIARYPLGGVLLFTRDYQDAFGNWLTAEALLSKLNSFQDAAMQDTGLKLFIGSDEEGGTVTRASRNPYLFPQKSPSPQALYAAGGIGAVINDAMEKSFRLTELGINVNFAPVCDVSTDPRDFIYDRTLGQDVLTTADYVLRMVLSMGDAGMGSVLKHFPGYGNNADTHTGIAVDDRPYDQFEAVDLLPFRAGIEAHGKIEPFVLVSHNIVMCMDAELPASLSPEVHRILREELGFDGVILTDDLAMDALKTYTENGSAAVLALLAGNDMIVTADFEAQIPQVLAAAQDGTLPMGVIDAACLRVLRTKGARFLVPWDAAWEFVMEENGG